MAVLSSSSAATQHTVCMGRREKTPLCLHTARGCSKETRATLIFTSKASTDAACATGESVVAIQAQGLSWQGSWHTNANLHTLVTLPGITFVPIWKGFVWRHLAYACIENVVYRRETLFFVVLWLLAGELSLSWSKHAFMYAKDVKKQERGFCTYCINGRYKEMYWYILGFLLECPQ